MRRGARIAAAAAGMLLITCTLQAQVGGNYDLRCHTIDAGGATFSSAGSYRVGGTIGQPDSYTQSNGGYLLAGGSGPAYLWRRCLHPGASHPRRRSRRGIRNAPRRRCPGFDRRRRGRVPRSIGRMLGCRWRLRFGLRRRWNGWVGIIQRNPAAKLPRIVLRRRIVDAQPQRPGFRCDALRRTETAIPHRKGCRCLRFGPSGNTPDNAGHRRHGQAPEETACRRQKTGRSRAPLPRSIDRHSQAARWKDAGRNLVRLRCRRAAAESAHHHCAGQCPSADSLWRESIHVSPARSNSSFGARWQLALRNQTAITLPNRTEFPEPTALKILDEPRIHRAESVRNRSCRLPWHHSDESAV